MSEAAITVIVAGMVQVALAFIAYLTLRSKLQYGIQKAEEISTKADSVEAKVDDNTHITKTSANVSVANARAAVATATEARNAAVDARTVVDNINRKLNGGIDSAIQQAIDPIRKKLEDHAEVDERNVKEVNDKIATLTKYVHERNHDLLDTMQAVVTKIDLVLEHQSKNSSS